MRLLPLALMTAVVAGGPVFAQSPTRTAPILTEAGALTALKAAERLAVAEHEPSAIAVVDADGLLLAFVRMDDARPGCIELAIGKARSAALMQRPTEELEANAANGRVGLATAGLTALRGGAPLRTGGIVVGAIGVAGLKKENDAKTAASVSAGFPLER